MKEASRGRHFRAMNVLAIALFAARSTGGAEATIRIDATRTHQVMEGFGVTHGSLVYGDNDVIGPWRAEALDWVYNEVQINIGNLEASLWESKNSIAANDNGNPSAIDWGGFYTAGADNMKKWVLDRVPPAFDGWYVHAGGSAIFGSAWLGAVRGSSYPLFLSEITENMAASLLYWRDTLKATPPRYHMPMNEPTSGNVELGVGGDEGKRQVVDILRSEGAWLEGNGFALKLVTPNEETVARSIEVARAVLADPEVRARIGAIGYHVYPYGSIYSATSRILATSGSGSPAASEVGVRGELRALAAANGLPVWMTEVSHGDLDALSFDSFRARAIHIHDELEYADAAAYFGMLNLWDRTSQEGHNPAISFDPHQLEGSLVLIDQPAAKVYRMPIGYAIGHYARWVRRGAVRIEATGSDPLVLTSAFRDAGQGKLVVVLINNAPTDRTARIDLVGLGVRGSAIGEQSTAAGYWKALAPFAPASPSAISLDLPPRSATTLSVDEGEEPVFIRGDATLDGTVDLADIVAILTYLFIGPSILPCLDAADADDSGAVDLVDPLRILFYFFAGEAPPLAPFPEPGPDASAGGPGCEESLGAR